MARSSFRLSAAKIKSETRPGFYSDGMGLYLQIGPAGTKSWVFKYTVHGQRRGMGLGPVNLADLAKARPDPKWNELTLTWGSMTLAEARLEVAKLAALVRTGIDPLEAKETQRRAKLEEDAEKDRRKTFKECAEIVIERREKPKKNGKLPNSKALAQWAATFEAHVYNDDCFKNKKIDELTRRDVARVLEPIWHTTSVTAERLRGRIEAVFNYAKGVEAYHGDNPAAWGGMLEAQLGERSKVTQHQPALPHKLIGAFMAELRKREGMSARALEFGILCASRSGEVLGARRGEIDLENRIWTIPASRMKVGKEHRVPLSDAAVAVLKALPLIVGNKYVFPAPRGGPMSDMALSAIVRRMHDDMVREGGDGWIDPIAGRRIVPHGFRSSFRDWCAERGYEREMAEMALAHNVGDAVERAYRRTDMVERRWAMMQDWANYCLQPIEYNVVSIAKGAA